MDTHPWCIDRLKDMHPNGTDPELEHLPRAATCRGTARQPAPPKGTAQFRASRRIPRMACTDLRSLSSAERLAGAVVRIFPGSIPIMPANIIGHLTATERDLAVAGRSADGVPSGPAAVSKWFKRISTTVPFVCTLGLYVDWQHDNATLRQQAVAVTTNLPTDSARIHAINNWVYHNKDFGKNKRFFIIPALGPTPIQVLESGGDCADKSRLVAAMLSELNIKAGLILISRCLHCPPIHTVVEAQQEKGRMVADPVWNVDYPASDGHYLGVRDLAWTDLGRKHVAELRLQRGTTDKIARMPDTEATFEYAMAINWDKNAATAAVATALRLLGHEPEIMYRPRFLEDPKLALLLFCLAIGIGIVAVWFLFGIGNALAKAIARRPARLQAALPFNSSSA